MGLRPFAVKGLHGFEAERAGICVLQQLSARLQNGRGMMGLNLQG